MSKWESPTSFSSSLLDKIYRSIDENERSNDDVKFYGDMKTTTLSRRNSKSGRDAAVEEEMAAIRRACLIEKWIVKKAKEKAEAEMRSRKLESDQDDVLFTSNSCSSESSSGALSSSDTEFMYGSRPQKASCFVPSLWPKPIRTRPVKTEEKKTEKKQSALFPPQRDFSALDDFTHSRVSDRSLKMEAGSIKSKSRALKLYDNLKKVKQPVSPGGRVASFLNSLFTSGQVKKAKGTSSLSGYEDSERKIYSLQGSTCSSASSFSRSILSKHSPSTREKLRNGIKKSVQFYPVNIVVGEDCQASGQKCVYEEQDARLMPVTVPTAWKIGRSQSRRTEEDIVKLRVLEKSRQAEEAAREFLKDHRRNQAKNESLFKRDFDNNDDDIDDDAASCSSSDLFELDHLAVAGKERYLEELPVYETTRVNRTNRAIF